MISVATRGWHGSGLKTISPATRGYVPYLPNLEQPTGYLSRNCSMPVEMLKGLAVDLYADVQWLNNNNILNIDCVLAIDSLAMLQIAALLNIDHVRPVAVDKACPVDARLPLQLEAVSPLDWPQAISNSVAAQVDYRSILMSDRTMPLDSRAYMIADKTLQIDVRTAITLSGVFPIEHLSLLVRDVSLPIGAMGGWGLMVFLHPHGEVHFYTLPTETLPMKLIKPQVTRRTSDGDMLVSSKSLHDKRLHTLHIRGVDRFTIEALEYFMSDAVVGIKDPFSYFDVYNQAHTVRFSSPDIRRRQTGIDSFDVDLLLEEEL